MRMYDIKNEKDSIDILAEEISSILTECFASDGMLMESDLSNSQIEILFRTLAAERNAGTSIQSQTKNNIATIGKALGVPKKMAIKVQTTLKDLTKKLESNEMVQKAESGASWAIDKLDNKVAIAQKKAREALENTEGGEKFMSSLDSIGKYAKNNPKKTAFAIGALTAVTTFVTGGMGGPVTGLLIRGSLEMIKGEKFSSAVKKGAITAALGGAVGGIFGMASDQISDLVASAVANDAVPELEIIANEIQGYRTVSVKLTGTGGNYFNSMIMSPEYSDAFNDIMQEDPDLRDNDYLRKRAAQISKLDELFSEVEANTDQDELSSKIEKYKELGQESQEVYNDTIPLVNVANAASAGIAGGSAEAKANESVQLDEGPVDFAKRAARKAGIMDREKFTKEDLYKAWVDTGKPTDSDEIYNFLKKSPFRISKREFWDATAVYEKIPEDVLDLVQIIKKHGMEDAVLDLLSSEFKIKTKVSESILFEKDLADRDIKSFFLTLAKEYNATSRNSTENVNAHVKKWADQINKMEDKNQRIAMVKEIVNFLANRHGETEWKNVYKGVQKLIKDLEMDPNITLKAIQSINDGKVMEKAMFYVCNKLLSECNMSWSNLHTRPITEGTMVRFRPILLQRKALMEDIFIDLINFEKIHNNRQYLQLGRYKKD